MSPRTKTLRLTEAGQHVLKLQDQIAETAGLLVGATEKINRLDEALRKISVECSLRMPGDDPAESLESIEAIADAAIESVVPAGNAPGGARPTELLERWAEQNKATAAARKALLADVAEEMREVLCDALSALVMPTSEDGKAHTVARVRSVLAKVPGTEASHG